MTNPQVQSQKVAVVVSNALKNNKYHAENVAKHCVSKEFGDSGMDILFPTPDTKPEEYIENLVKEYGNNNVVYLAASPEKLPWVQAIYDQKTRIYKFQEAVQEWSEDTAVERQAYQGSSHGYSIGI